MLRQGQKLFTRALVGMVMLGLLASFVPRTGHAQVLRGQAPNTHKQAGSMPEDGGQSVQRNNPIIVKAEQPNVWTLEQAHYLLEQMHRRNLDLKAKRLDELDPNEINGLHFEVLKTLVELGVKFDQADLAANKLLSGHQTTDGSTPSGQAGSAGQSAPSGQ